LRDNGYGGRAFQGFAKVWRGRIIRETAGNATVGARFRAGSSLRREPRKFASGGGASVKPKDPDNTKTNKVKNEDLEKIKKKGGIAS
jgi:hypothetical protein